MLTLTQLGLLPLVPPRITPGAAPGPRACISALLTLDLVGGWQGVVEPGVAKPHTDELRYVGDMGALLLVSLGLANCPLSL